MCILNDHKKPIIFSMARLDRVKNMTGLVEWFAKNKHLRDIVLHVLGRKPYIEFPF